MYERNEDNENADESEDYVNDKYEEQNDIVVKISEANITEENFSNSDECKWKYWDRRTLRMGLSGNLTISHTKLEALLAILRRRLLSQLPKCAKTFLGTTKASYNIQIFNNEEMNLFISVLLIILNSPLIQTYTRKT